MRLRILALTATGLLALGACSGAGDKATPISGDLSASDRAVLAGGVEHLAAVVGEGAALLASDPVNLDAAVRLRRFGIDYSEMRLPNGDLNPRFDIPLAGFNLAMNEIAATLGLENMRHADDIVSRCRENGRFFDNSLKNVLGIRVLSQMPKSISGYWVYALLAEQRDALIRKLLAHGIGAQRLHLRNDNYTCFGGPGFDLPGVTEFDEHNLCIPSGWWVGAEERERISGCIQAGW